MKKIFIGIISLTILFILSTVAYASKPSECSQMEKTPSRPEQRIPQSSEYLINCATKRLIDSNLTFGSSSEESSFIKVYEENPLENEESDVEPPIKCGAKFEDQLDFEALLEHLEE